MIQPCQEALAASDLATYIQLFVAHFTVDLMPSSRQGDVLLPSTPAMLITSTEHFDRAGVFFKFLGAFSLSEKRKNASCKCKGNQSEGILDSGILE